jgi:hypothetical protein
MDRRLSISSALRRMASTTSGSPTSSPESQQAMFQAPACDGRVSRDGPSSSSLSSRATSGLARVSSRVRRGSDNNGRETTRPMSMELAAMLVYTVGVKCRGKSQRGETCRGPSKLSTYSVVFFFF